MKKILVIDDELPTLEMLQLFLEALGYEVLTAKNEREGLTLFEAQKPPIVLTDIKMPGKDGLAVLEQLKRISPATKVVVITGHGDSELARKAFDLHASAFIHKPLDTDALESILKRIEQRLSAEDGSV